MRKEMRWRKRWRVGDRGKEKQTSSKVQLERLRNSNTSCCLFRKDPWGGITSL